MDAKTKASQLFSKFYTILIESNSDISQEILITDLSKKCAMLAVNEIIDSLSSFGYNGAMYDSFTTGKITFVDDELPEDYWNQVKNEIENI